MIIWNGVVVVVVVDDDGVERYTSTFKIDKNKNKSEVN